MMTPPPEHFCKTGLQANGALFHIFYSFGTAVRCAKLRGAVNGQKRVICHIVVSDNNPGRPAVYGRQAVPVPRKARSLF